MPVQGYEIHCGISQGEALNRPLIQFDDGKQEGAISDDGQIMGTYLHGLFDQASSCSALLNWAGLQSAAAVHLSDVRQKQLDRLADTLEQHLDFKAMGLL